MLEHVSKWQVHPLDSLEILQISGQTYKCLLLTNIFHSETVILTEIGDVVLTAELHAVRDPNRCVVCIEEALSF